MKRAELYKIRENWVQTNHQYIRVHASRMDYSILKNIMYRCRSGRGINNTINECIIMADTETSKKSANTYIYRRDGTLQAVPVENHICAWTISIRAFNTNMCTIYGTRPSEMMQAFRKIIDTLEGEETIIYFHNLAYDYQFLRKFLYKEFGYPEKALNTKPHYPILLKWENLTIKDSLILAQRSLDRWAKDMNVEHQKAIGKWDYNLIRHQDHVFTEEELEYIEHDTLAGVECLDAMLTELKKNIVTAPYTATGIPREQVTKLGKENNWHDRYLKMLLTYSQYLIMEYVYHGGYTHGNRHYINYLITDKVRCYDFASSYPYVMLAYKYPMEAFRPLEELVTAKDILDRADTYAFTFKLILVKPRLKSDDIPMPALQFSKCVNSLNAVLDNGRILCADYVEIYLNEIDLEVISSQYTWQHHICCDVEFARKDYLPRWFTDYVFQCFYDKTMLKGGDPVSYAIAKAKLNSLYGMCVQKSIRDELQENYQTGEYVSSLPDPEASYIKYTNNHARMLPYQWGVWVTAYAFRNLFELGSCVDGIWLYSDTDSCYATNWNESKVEAYNNKCKKLLKANNYGPVVRNGREYWLGVAETDGDKDLYSEFKVMGAKRYCGRSVADGELHITVAGVPKSGFSCLEDDINNFKPGLVFDGNVTYKKLHQYIYVENIYIDENNNETGDSIDLNNCDYLLDSVTRVDWMSLLEEEIEVQIYDELESKNAMGKRT